MSKLICGKPHKILIYKDQIAKRIEWCANKIIHDYKDSKKTLLLVPILVGGLDFAVALRKELREMGKITHMDPVRFNSYKNNKPGPLKMLATPGLDWSKYDVLILEDIVDTAKTLKKAHRYFKDLDPASLKYAVVVEKTEHEALGFFLDYVLFPKVDRNLYLTGFGLDYKGEGREFEDIWCEVKSN